MAGLARAIPRIFSNLCLLSSILLPWPVMACSCSGAHSPCYEVSGGSAVFTGKVISVSPAFLDRLNRSSRADAGRVGQFYDQFASGVPAQNLQGMKEAFLADDDNNNNKNGNSKDDDRGKDVKNGKARSDDDRSKSTKNAKVKDSDKQGKNAKSVKTKDDGDDDDAGALAAGKLFSVWTPSFDCGVEFQAGETYLVYASMDEDADTVETDLCMGTRRLSDARADLPYLSFVQIDLRANRPEKIRPSGWFRNI